MGSTRERNPSLWISTTESEPSDPLGVDLRVDVVVVGAGITGLTTARLLAATGRSVAVVEAGDLCAGATGFTTAKVTSLHSTIYSRLIGTWGVERASVYATANESAIRRIERFIGDDGIDCGWEAAPAYTYTEDPGAVGAIEEEAESARRAGLLAVLTTETDLPYPVAAAVRVDDQAQFHPRAYCLGLAGAVVGAGGSIFEHTRVLGIDRGARSVTTDHGTITADAVVLGTHVPISDLGGHFARMEPMRSYACALRAPGERTRGMYISIDDPTRSIRSTPDGWTIVGGEGHKVGQDPDTTRRYAALESWALERFDGSTVEHRWSAQDYVSADGLPFVGRLAPGTDGVFVATGFGKWGMTNGTVAALILADLVQGTPNPWAETFDSTRLAAKQGARDTLSANADVAKHFVGDRLGSLRPGDAADLGPGSGAIASLDGHKVAAHRDDDGRLHAVSATCTHLGCQVAFNAAERTWDCPCHGSRFDVDGRVLEGPAVHDLATAEPAGSGDQVGRPSDQPGSTG